MQTVIVSRRTILREASREPIRNQRPLGYETFRRMSVNHLIFRKIEKSYAHRLSLVVSRAPSLFGVFSGWHDSKTGVARELTHHLSRRLGSRSLGRASSIDAMKALLTEPFSAGPSSCTLRCSARFSLAESYLTGARFPQILQRTERLGYHAT